MRKKPRRPQSINDIYRHFKMLGLDVSFINRASVFMKLDNGSRSLQISVNGNKCDVRHLLWSTSGLERGESCIVFYFDSSIKIVERIYKERYFDIGTAREMMKCICVNSAKGKL